PLFVMRPPKLVVMPATLPPALLLKLPGNPPPIPSTRSVLENVPVFVVVPPDIVEAPLTVPEFVNMPVLVREAIVPPFVATPEFANAPALPVVLLNVPKLPLFTAAKVPPLFVAVPAEIVIAPDTTPPVLLVKVPPKGLMSMVLANVPALVTLPPE